MDTTDALRALGQRLAELRNARGLSQAAVDRHFGWPNNTTFRLERGNAQKFPSPETLRQLAAFYNVSVVDDLLASAGYTDDDTTPTDIVTEHHESVAR